MVKLAPDRLRFVSHAVLRRGFAAIDSGSHDHSLTVSKGESLSCATTPGAARAQEQASRGPLQRHRNTTARRKGLRTRFRLPALRPKQLEPFRAVRQHRE